MRNLLFFTLGLTVLCVGCSTAPVRAPVAAEPADRPLATAECVELRLDQDSWNVKVEGNRYGWTQARIDVERGAVVKVEIVDSSPKGLFDDQAIAVMKNWRYLSDASARGCFISHRWG